MAPDASRDRPPDPSCHVSIYTLTGLPSWSTGPRDPASASAFAEIAAAGYAGVQLDDPARTAAAAPLAVSGMARLLHAADVDGLAAAHADAGLVCTTLHLGHGLESEDEACRLVEAVLDATSRRGYPLFVETHRATITQDMRRTLDLVARFPELRFNIDIVNWYAGLEMPYGDLAGKLDALAPVFARARYIHGRIGNSAVMQVPLPASGAEPEYIDHFRDVWTRCARGYLAGGEFTLPLIFAPELLPAWIETGGRRAMIYYAALDADGAETSDRWEDGLRLCDMMRDCYAAAASGDAVGFVGTA